MAEDKKTDPTAGSEQTESPVETPTPEPVPAKEERTELSGFMNQDSLPAMAQSLGLQKTEGVLFGEVGQRYEGGGIQVEWHPETEGIGGRTPITLSLIHIYSYGTYIATMAAAKESNLYSAYVGIGQMSNTINSELNGLQKCIEAAEAEGNKDDITYLSGLEGDISQGQGIIPREYVRKYGFAARNINEDADYLKGFLFGSEYNLLDAVRLYVACGKYQDLSLIHIS